MKRQRARSSDSGDGKPRPGSKDLGQLARRISGWATKLLVTGVILVAGLAFGRQALVWWGQAAPSVDSRANATRLLGPDGLGKHTLPHWLQFGDERLAIGRVSFQGTKQEAFASLRERCRRIARRGDPVTRPLGYWEKEMLATVEDLQPAEGTAGFWQIYQLDGPVLLAAAVRSRLGGSRSPPQREVAEMDRRVVSWGLGFPLEPDAKGARTRWIFMICDATTAAAGGVLADLPVAPIPPNGRRTTLLRVEGGGGLIGLTGSGPEHEWRDFYDKWFDRHGWASASGWRLSSGIWHARYENDRLGCVDVQIVVDRPESLTGMLVVSPPAETDKR